MENTLLASSFHLKIINMKPINPFLKIAAFTSFSILLILFVAFRAGALDKYFQKDPEPLAAYKEKERTIEIFPGPDTPDKKQTMMSSSKSAIIYEPKFSPHVDTSFKLHPLQDTSKKKTADSVTKLKKIQVMGGSKSAYIYDPSDWDKKTPAKKDTGKKTTPKK